MQERKSAELFWQAESLQGWKKTSTTA